MRKFTNRLRRKARALAARTAAALDRVSTFVKAAPTLALLIFGVVALYQTIVFKGLMIEPFLVPPDFAQQGIDGTGLAARLRDRLSGLVSGAEKYALRAPEDVSGDWGAQSKIDVRQASGALESLMRALSQWLSGETRLTGEVYRTVEAVKDKDGNVSPRQMIALSFSLQGRRIDVYAAPLPAAKDAAEKAEALDNALDDLIVKAAYRALEETQPYRFAIVQANRDCALTVAAARRACLLDGAHRLEAMAQSGPKSEWRWYYSKASERFISLGLYREGLADAGRALALDAWHIPSYNDASDADAALGDYEAELRSARAGRNHWQTCFFCAFSPVASATFAPGFDAKIAMLAGDFDTAVLDHTALGASSFARHDDFAPAAIASAMARGHDAAGALRLLDAHTLDGAPWDDASSLAQFQTIGVAVPRFFIAAERGQWPAAAQDLFQADIVLRAKFAYADTIRHTTLWPLLAYAYARSGNLAGARALIAMTPHDCYLCLDMRGRIAARAKDWNGAARWFAQAAARAPSIPFAYAGWGEMRLASGDAAGAIAKFKIAHQKGPRFADALELWGEALTAENRSNLALGKFEAAAKLAPKWGRLRLKWGEALRAMGRDDDARVAFDTARTLDLSDADRAELDNQAGATHDRNRRQRQ